MKVPSKITIAGQEWRIYLEKEAPPRLVGRRHKLLAEGTQGFTEYATREIVLAHGLSQEQTEITLLHELLHAIYHASGDRNLGAELEERIVEALDTHLHEVVIQLLESNK